MRHLSLLSVALLLGLATLHAEDLMVREPALAHIHQPVITVGVGRQQEKAWINEITKRVADDSLHDFAIEKLQPHPDPINNRRVRMKVEMLVDRVSLKAVYIEDRLDIFG